MNYNLFPVQRVLLEYILKLGDVIFFPGNSKEEDINNCNISNMEKDLLIKIRNNNLEFFKEFGDCAFILSSSDYDMDEIKNNTNTLEHIFYEVNRRLDYLRILECPFQD